eukprot:GILK01004350.1.p1 GENE.GILK01004350.1~~GILK01004350.1.p1  ORF type:complete len:1191 (+),score=182.52 GILK01004350.1:184-3756(+)
MGCASSVAAPSKVSTTAHENEKQFVEPKTKIKDDVIHVRVPTPLQSLDPLGSEALPSTTLHAVDSCNPPPQATRAVDPPIKRKKAASSVSSVETDKTVSILNAAGAGAGADPHASVAVAPPCEESLDDDATAILLPHAMTSVTPSGHTDLEDQTVGALPNLTASSSSTRNDIRTPSPELRQPVRAFEDGEDVCDAESRQGRVLKLLGTGAMGEVYHVLENHGEHAAMKCIKLGNRSKEEIEQITADLLSEAKTLLQLGVHRNLAVLHYVHTLDKMVGGINQRLILLFMECVDGGSLEGLIKRESMSVRELLEISIGIANGLAHMHSHGWIHQDLKPDNVLVTDSKVPKITDYGTCSKLDSDVSRHVLKSGQPGAEVVDDRQTVRAVFSGGTPGYWSKEQNDGYVKGEAVLLTRRSDMWSYALTVIQMFARMKFWRRGELGQSILQHYLSHIDKGTTHAGARQPNMQSIPDPALMPARLVELLHQCLEPNEADRPQSMDVIISTLVEVLRSECGVEYVRSSEDESVRSIDTARLYRNLGMAYERAGKFDDALSTYEEGRTKYPSANEWNYLLGEMYRAQKQYEKSLEYSEEGLKLHGANVMYHNSAGLCYLQLNQLDKAAEHFEAGIALAPDDDVLHNSLGMIHLRRGQIKESLKCFLRAVEIKPNSLSAMFNAGICCYQLDQYDEARAYFEQLCNTSPGHTDYWYYSGLSYRKKGNNEEAIKRFRRAYEMDSSDVKRYRDILACYLDTTLYEEAYQFVMQLISRHPDCVFLFEFGLRLSQLAVESGQQQFKEKRHYFTKHLWAQITVRATSLNAAWQVDEAIQALSAYIDSSPSSDTLFSALCYRAKYLSPLNVLDRAEADLTAAEALLSLQDGHPKLQYELYSSRAAFHASKGDHDGAVGWATKAIEIAPADMIGAAYFERASLFHKEGMVGLALPDMGAAHRADPTLQAKFLDYAASQAAMGAFEYAALICREVQATDKYIGYAKMQFQANPGRPHLGLDVIQHHLEAGEYAAAKPFALLLYANFPNHWAAIKYLIVIHKGLEERDALINACQAMIKVAEGDSELTEEYHSALTEIGCSLCLANRLEESEEYLSRACAEGVENVVVYDLLTSLLQQADTAEARAKCKQVCEKGLSLFPSHPSLLAKLNALLGTAGTTTTTTTTTTTEPTGGDRHGEATPSSAAQTAVE